MDQPSLGLVPRVRAFVRRRGAKEIGGIPLVLADERFLVSAESDRQSLLTALAFVNAWSIDDDADAWMNVATKIKTSVEWERVATSLAHLAYLLAGRAGINENKNADQVLQELTRVLRDDETHGLAS